MRQSGILLPVFSLPSAYGIGCFSEEAREFIRKLRSSGQSIWQILPLGPTSYGDSPYQSTSAFAGNPYFIDPDTLCREGLLSGEECREYIKSCPRGLYVDYRFLFNTRRNLLDRAFARFDMTDPQYRAFVEKESYWIEDYAGYAALKELFGGAPFYEWPDDLRDRRWPAAEQMLRKNHHRVEFHKFLQYLFMKQWQSIKDYAKSLGVQIVGDIPIYTACDSADVWSRRELFEVDPEGKPLRVAGCPPDSFSADGQRWGNPLYRWKKHSDTGFEWWTERLKRCMELYDVIRVDHFRGFESYYAIDGDGHTAVKGRWEKGPGKELFDVISKKCPDIRIIAEDLGFITDDVRELLGYTGFPGMKVLQFAFGDGGDEHLPYNQVKNSVVYTGTHDNHTALGWFRSAPPSEVSRACRYMNIKAPGSTEFCDGFVRLAASGVSDTCIIPLQDYLCMGDECRINVPGAVRGVWRVRLGAGEFDEETEKKIYDITKTYGRLKKG